MIQKVASTKIINSNTKMEISAVAAESLILDKVKIIEDGIHTTVKFQIIVLEFDIRYLVIVLFLLVHCLIDVVYFNKYPWILYYKLKPLYQYNLDASF